MTLLINIPAFNEAKTIATVIASLPKNIHGHDVMVQVIDDGSTDATVELARWAGAKVISHDYNQWVWVAFRTAVQNFLASGADIMVNIDADGQFDVADIPALVAPLVEQRSDIVIGSRFGDKDASNMPWIKNFLNRLIAGIVGFLMGKKIDDLTCGFRAYTREALLRLNLTTSYTYTQETIIDAIGKQIRILWIPVNVRYFHDRKSRVVKTITSYISRSLMIILRAVRDVRPLMFFGLPGILCILFWLWLFLAFLVNYLVEFQTTPYRTWLIISGSSFLTGLLFLIFASIADMIKRHGRVNDEILYMLKREYYDKKIQNNTKGE